MSNKDPEFLNKIVTVDESLFVVCDLENKQQCTTCVGSNLPKAKKLRFQKSCLKMILVAVFDSRILIHKEFVPTDKTINAEYYEGIVDQLLKQIAHIRPDFQASNDWFLLHNQALAYNVTSVCSFGPKYVIVP